MKIASVLLFFAAVVHCRRPEPVSCKFIGTVGQRVSFENVTYAIPASGSIEIVSDVHAGCESKPRAVRIINRETLKCDRFGMWTMKLPVEAKK